MKKNTAPPLRNWRLLEDALSGRLLLIAVRHKGPHHKIQSIVRKFDPHSGVVVSSTGICYRLARPPEPSPALDAMQSLACFRAGFFVSHDVSTELFVENKYLENE